MEWYAGRLDAEATGQFESPGGMYVGAFAGVYLTVSAVFGLSALAWMAGHPTWYWRIPLILLSVVLGMLGLFLLNVGPGPGCLTLVSSGIGVAVACRPSVDTAAEQHAAGSDGAGGAQLGDLG